MKLYIKGEDGTLFELPVLPEEISVDENQKIETVEVLSAGEIPIPGYQSLVTFSITSFLPTVKDGNYISHGVDALTIIDKLRRWKKSNTPVRVVLTGMFGANMKNANVNELYLITDFKTSSSFGYETDIKYTIKFLEWKKLAPRKLEVPKPKPTEPEKKPPAVVTPPQPQRPATTPPKPKEAPKRYHTVVWGDCLWMIARKYYGDGSQWRKIYEANKSKIKNPHWIYPGQVFLIP